MGIGDWAQSPIPILLTLSTEEIFSINKILIILIVKILRLILREN